MRVRFVGNPANGFDGPDVLPLFGVEFVKGEWTEVDASVFARLSRHSHFAVEGEDEALSQIAPERPVSDEHVHVPADYEVEAVVSDPSLAALAKFDHDGDGKPGGSLPKKRRKKLFGVI